MAQQASTAGGALSILEVIGCAFMGKTITSMWLFINTLQFIVFLGIWQISTSDRLRATQVEVKRISLGEYFDDIDIADSMGIEFLQKDEAEPSEEIGEERMGDSDPLKNLGTTFILLTFVFILVILIILALVWAFRRIKLSEKNQERFEKIKGKIFFNALIRYSLLNAIKLNLIAMFSLSSGDVTGTKKATMVLLLVILALLPLVYTWAVHKKRDTLDQPKTVESIGNLYQGLTLVSSDE